MKKKEIKIVIRIVLQMGIIKLSNCRMYWASSTRNELIEEGMTRNRFDESITVLHYNDNHAITGRDSPVYNDLFVLVV